MRKVVASEYSFLRLKKREVKRFVIAENAALQYEYSFYGETAFNLACIMQILKVSEKDGRYQYKLCKLGGVSRLRSMVKFFSFTKDLNT